MSKETGLSRQIFFSIVIGFSLIAMFFIAANYDEFNKITFPIFEEMTKKPQDKKSEDKIEKLGNVSMKQFSSDEEFKKYIENNTPTGSYGMGGGFRTMETTSESFDTASGLATKTVAPQASRFSQTNVQVLSIDEPDFAKTDGTNIYLSQEQWGGWITPMAMPEIDVMSTKMIAPDYRDYSKTKIISAFPISSLAKMSEIKKAGNILLSENKLIIFAQDGIYAYDITDKKNPTQSWKIEYKNSNYLSGARMYKGKIYLITRSGINTSVPCPIKPLAYNGKDLLINCSSIYYPTQNSYVDSTFTAMLIDSQTGEVQKNITFVGSANDSVVYMSENNLYLTYQLSIDTIKFFTSFFNEKCADLIPATLTDRLNKVAGYDISQRAKNVELETLWSGFISNLDPDESLRIQNEITNRFNDYRKSHLKELEQTAIVQIGLENFNLKAQGKVPGSPLNQFCLDEYQGNLRIATTIGQRWFDAYLQGINFSNNYTNNDIYVLNQNLETIGNISNLGIEERIYSARFIKDKGYLVTFKQVDPFYILDLKDPKNPKMSGQLKIPGYSGYLHPLRDNIILGVGKEDQNVKLSLFDVSNPENPVEKSKYLLNEYYTNILNDHHGFLADSENQVFFLPGSQGAYIFSYKDDVLSLKKAIDKIYAQRAVYIDKYLYIISTNDKIIVLDESNWTKVKELDLKD